MAVLLIFVACLPCGAELAQAPPISDTFPIRSEEPPTVLTYDQMRDGSLRQGLPLTVAVGVPISAPSCALICTGTEPQFARGVHLLAPRNREYWYESSILFDAENRLIGVKSWPLPAETQKAEEVRTYSTPAYSAPAQGYRAPCRRG